MMQTLRRTYIDTMVFVYLISRPTTDPLHTRSLKFFEEVENGTYEAVITTFTYAEYTAVMKETISRRSGKSPSAADMEKLRTEFEGFVEKEGIEVLDADDLSTAFSRSEVFRWCREVVERTGTVKGRDNRWRTIGGADAVHVVLANRAGAELYATFDEGFKAIDELGWDLKPLIIQEVY